MEHDQREERDGTGAPPSAPSSSPSPVRIALGIGIVAVFYPVLVFGSARTLDWPVAWAYVAVAVVGTVAAHLGMAVRHPDTLGERARGLKSPGIRRWDRVLVRVVAWGPVIAILTAGFDHRFQASSFAAPVLQWAALPLLALGYALTGWAMAENRFFAAVARVQDDRGQAVVESGPYRWVRHPGYAGAALATALVPLILDSAWALVPAGITVVALVARTALEDAMLRAELPGYDDYAARTRHRLIPGLW